jgi:hypothetical protein
VRCPAPQHEQSESRDHEDRQSLSSRHQILLITQWLSSGDWFEFLNTDSSIMEWG